MHAVGRHAARDQIIAHHLRAPGAERQIVFACAALVGMAFDGELAVLAVGIEPLRLLIERGARLRRELGRIGREE